MVDMLLKMGARIKDEHLFAVSVEKGNFNIAEKLLDKWEDV
jgi:hypothetical protein